MSNATTACDAPIDAAADWRQALFFASATEAGILAALPGTVRDITSRAGTDEEATRVLLEALEVWHFVSSKGDGWYDRGKGWPPSGESNTLLNQARFIRGTAAHLPDRLQGIVAPLKRRSRSELASWQEGMATRVRRVAPPLIDACLARVPTAQRVLDLGGGHGEYGLEFARRGLAVVLQDRPEVLELPERRGVWAAGGVELFPADFFQALPEQQFDIVFCAGVTHTMSDERNRLLYERVGPVVAPDGALIIVTFLRGTPRARLFAVQMLVVGNRGDTHPEDDYRQWLTDAGFSMEVAQSEDLEQTLIVAHPT